MRGPQSHNIYYMELNFRYPNRNHCELEVTGTILAETRLAMQQVRHLFCSNAVPATVGAHEHYSRFKGPIGLSSCLFLALTQNYDAQSQIHGQDSAQALSTVSQIQCAPMSVSQH